MKSYFRPFLLFSALAVGQPMFAGPDVMPEPVARVTISHYLAGRLSEECNAFRINDRVSRLALREAISKSKNAGDVSNSYQDLQSELGESFLVGAERAYFKQMNVYFFDRASACAAATKAIEDKQEIGRFLKSN